MGESEAEKRRPEGELTRAHDEENHAESEQKDEDDRGVEAVDDREERELAEGGAVEGEEGAAESAREAPGHFSRGHEQSADERRANFRGDQRVLDMSRTLPILGSREAIFK